MTSKTFVCALLWCAPAMADELKIGIGAGAAPQFAGSSDYRFIPFPSLSWSNDLLTIRTRGPGVEIDFIPNPGLGFGPLVSWSGGRDSGDIDDPVVSLLRETDDTIEVGGFGEIAFPVGEFAGSMVLATARGQVTRGFGGHEGVAAKASAGFLRPDDLLTLGVTANVTWASDEAMFHDFGITAADQVALGLAAYTPGSGIRDAGVSMFANYKMTEQWSLTAVASYTRLLGDAADSPIVTQRGTENQLFGGLGVTYTFR